MLNEHGLKILSIHQVRCKFSAYQDMLYALRHFKDGMSLNRLIGICDINYKEMKRLQERTKDIGHIEYRKNKNAKITEEGIKYNVLYFAFQDRFGIREIASSTFEPYDVIYDEEAIEMLMTEFINQDRDIKPCHSFPRFSHARDTMTTYIDGLRYLEKHRNGIRKSELKSIWAERYHQFIKIAVSKGHIELADKTMSTSEGFNFLHTFNGLVRKYDLGDFVPSLTAKLF